MATSAAVTAPGHQNSPLASYQTHPEFDHKPPPPSHAKEVTELALEEGGDGKHPMGRTHKRFLWYWPLPRKQWIWAVVATVLLVLLVLLLILFFAIIPAIFQSVANKVQITVNHLDLLTIPTDPAAREMDVELSLHVKHDSSIKSSMREAKSTLYYQGGAFGTVTIPPQEFAKGAHEFDIVIKDKATILDADVFIKLSKALLTDEWVDIDAKCKIKAHALGLTYGGIDLNHKFTVRGMHQFSDVHSNLTRINLHTCDGPHYISTVNITIDNLSDVGLNGIGVLNTSIWFNGGYLGYSRTNDSFQGLTRGMNSIPLEVTVSKDNATLKVFQSFVAASIGASAKTPAITIITGESPTATQAYLLKDAMKLFNMSLYFEAGLSGVTFNTTQCDLASLVGTPSGR